MAWQLDVSLETVLGMACKALQKSEELLKISESENSGPDSKTVAMTELGDAFVKRRSPVQVRASA